MSNNFLETPPDFQDQSTLADPYPDFCRLRVNNPVYWDESLNAWLLTRHDDVLEAQRDARRFSSRRVAQLVSARVPPEGRVVMEPFIRLVSRWMYMEDPPYHTRLRGLLGRAFTPRVIEELRASVQEIVDSLIRRNARDGRMDLVNDFFYPLPSMVLAHVYGIPMADAPLLKKWSDDIAVFLTGSLDRSRGPKEALHGVVEVSEYFGVAMESRRKQPRNDLISRVLAAAEGGDFSDEEICAQITFVLVAGYTTTMDMLGNGMFALLSNTEQLDLLRRDPELLPAAVEEMLRYDPPGQLSHRLATEDISMHGQTIRKGDVVFLVRAAANRDPSQFPDPDRFDITRKSAGHLAFGAGIHFCMGAALARLEGQIAVRTLLDCFPAIRLDPDAKAVWRADNLQFRGLKSLWVRF